MPGTSLNDQVSLSLSLVAQATITDMGQAVLNVLSARTYFDEFAKEFVALKTTQRCRLPDEHEAEEMGQGHTKSPRGSLLSGLIK